MMKTMDRNNAICSTKLKAGTSWQLMRQENILTAPGKKCIHDTNIDLEKEKAFALLDAITQNGSLPIHSGELHVIVCRSHCFEKDFMDTVIQDNINPIAKAEKLALLLASIVHRMSPSALITSPQDSDRLQTTFLLLFDKD